MNDDPVVARDGALSPARDGNDSDAGSRDEPDAGEGPSHQARPRSSGRPDRDGRRLSSSLVRRAKAGMTMQSEFMTHLMNSLDVVIFAELCALYYMDCSFTRLVMRAFVQYIYLTPKPEEFLKLMPAPRPQIYVIFATNILCILSHLIFALPQGSEAMRGYLHGGVIIDFIGQKAPTSRLGLLLLDCLVLLLQCMSCAVAVEKDRLKKIEIMVQRVSAGGIFKNADAPTPEPTAAVDLATGAQTSRQDLDSEERGVLRDDPFGADETNDIEMRPLMNERNPPATNDLAERSRVLVTRYLEIISALDNPNSADGPERSSLADLLMSGNGLVANFHIVNAIRTLMADSANDPRTAAYSLRLTGYSSMLAALTTQGQRGARRL